MSAASKAVALVVIGLPVLAIGGWVAVSAVRDGFASIGETMATLADPIAPEPPRFFYRVKADVTFDGKPYTIDNWVACNTKRFYAPDVGAHWGYEGSVESLGVRTADGGALFIKTPDLCRPAWARQNALDAGEPNTPPLSQVAAPANHLPEFYWINDADNPSEAEAYLSDVYYQRPDRRLTIEQLAIGSTTIELPKGVEVVDFGKKIPDPFNHCELIRPYAIHHPKENIVCFYAYGAFPYAEDEWRLSPGLVAFAEKSPQDRLTPVPPEYWREHHVDPTTTLKQLRRPTVREAQKSVEAGYIGGFGIPHLDETADGRCASMLAPVSTDTCRNMRLFDKALPIVCDDSRCKLLENEPGVYFYKDYPRPFPDKTLDVREEEIPLPGGEIAGWYDPSTKTFWWVTVEIDL